MYYMGLAEVKKEMAIKIGNAENTEELVISHTDYTNPHKVQHVEEHEIRYKGIMYDIVSRKQVGDKWVIRAVRDDKETFLANALIKTFHGQPCNGSSEEPNTEIKMDELYLGSAWFSYTISLPLNGSCSVGGGPYFLSKGHGNCPAEPPELATV